MTQQSDYGTVPELTSQDLVKLFAVTYLPLCEALVADGLVSRTGLSRRILALAAAEQPAAWAQVAVALATVLERPSKADRASGAEQARLTVITGGKID